MNNNKQKCDKSCETYFTTHVHIPVLKNQPLDKEQNCACQTCEVHMGEKLGLKEQKCEKHGEFPDNKTCPNCEYDNQPPSWQVEYHKRAEQAEKETLEQQILVAIAQECNIAREEGQPTSRLTSLGNKI